mmetsp:Transcript_1710/g.2473  ORF Transcript_1710/g.2473 Transcript_1710/m.2473 type:complete len:350 (+) Transcript_1710:82-1131(+)
MMPMKKKQLATSLMFLSVCCSATVLQKNNDLMGTEGEERPQAVATLRGEVMELRESLERMQALVQSMNKSITAICHKTCACSEEDGGNIGTCKYYGTPSSSNDHSKGKHENAIDRKHWIIPTFPQLYRVEEASWFDGLFYLGWLQHVSVYADRNFIGRFHEEGPLRKLWQDTVAFYDANHQRQGVLVESPIKWWFNIVPNLLFGRQYWRLYDSKGNLRLYGSPENYFSAMMRGDIRGDVLWSPYGSSQYLSRMTNTAQMGLHKWHITRNDNAKAAVVEEISIRNMAGKTKTGWLIEVENEDRIDPLIPGFFAAYNKMEGTTTTLDVIGWLLKLALTIAPFAYWIHQNAS